MIAEKRGRGRPPGSKNKVKPKRGRPTFRATAEQRKDVALLVSAGMTHADIARAIGISSPTLEKHFEDELRTGPAKQRAETIRQLSMAAAKGNVAAQKKLLELQNVSAAAAAMRQIEIGEDDKPEAAAAAKPKLGKKAQALVDAASVGGIYEVPPGPRLAVNNDR